MGEQSAAYEHWRQVAACMRCPDCQAAQIQLRGYSARVAHWRCRDCGRAWDTPMPDGTAAHA